MTAYLIKDLRNALGKRGSDATAKLAGMEDPSQASTTGEAADKPDLDASFHATEPKWQGQWRLLKYL